MVEEETPTSEGESPATPSEPSSSSRGLNYTALKDLFPQVEEANNRRSEYNNLLQNSPNNLEALLRSHASEAGFSLRPFEETITDAVEEKEYRVLASMGDQITSSQYAKALGPYNSSIMNHPEKALEGAPKRLIEMMVQRANKSRIKSLEGDYKDLTAIHLEVKEIVDNLKNYNSQDRDKRREARKAIREKFENEYGSEYEGDMHEAFLNLTAALHTDVEKYQKGMKERVDKIIEDVNASDNGRSYLTKVTGGSGMVRRYLETDFSEGLPDEE